MLQIQPNIGIPLSTQRLDQTLILEHRFLRENLMRIGDKIFTVTYCVNYALTNSHHNITFINNDRIDVPSLFEDIGKIYYPKRNEITELGTFINKPKLLTMIPQLNYPSELEKIKEESEIKKLENQVNELTIYLKNRI